MYSEIFWKTIFISVNYFQVENIWYRAVTKINYDTRHTFRMSNSTFEQSLFNGETHIQNV